MFLRTVAVLACAAYAAAAHCVQCPSPVGNYVLNPDATCFGESGDTVVTSCMYNGGLYCLYGEAGDLINTGSAPMCQKKAGIQDADDCAACK